MLTSVKAERERRYTFDGGVACGGVRSPETEEKETLRTLRPNWSDARGLSMHVGARRTWWSSLFGRRQLDSSSSSERRSQAAAEQRRRKGTRRTALWAL
jgi:hypothetical protein